jgi:hypothetical protein
MASILVLLLGSDYIISAVCLYTTLLGARVRIIADAAHLLVVEPSLYILN